MFDNDYLVLTEQKKEYTKKINELNKIIDICEQEHLVDDYDFYCISSKAKLIIDVIKREIDDLQKHSECEHNNIEKNIWYGNDVHHDYFIDQCTNCGKIFKKTKI